MYWFGGNCSLKTVSDASLSNFLPSFPSSSSGLGVYFFAVEEGPMTYLFDKNDHRNAKTICCEAYAMEGRGCCPFE